MSKKKLFDDDSEEDIALVTENDYAKKYDTWREKEEIHKLEQKYGPDALNSDPASSSDSDDDSDEAPEVDEETEAQFLKTLALLKTKDPRIYDPGFKCFDKETEKSPEKPSTSKTLTFDDSDDDDELQGADIFKIEKKAEIDDAQTNDEVAKHTVTTSNNKRNIKEGKIKEYLTGQADHIDDEVEKDLAPLKALWSDPKLNEGEAFLRDYILNKRYLEEGGAEGGADACDDAELEADARTVEEQGQFERAYNFRFEEPDDEYLKRFPRTMNSTRPKDDRRARKRAEVRTRKEQEKQRKMDEIGRLKALKLKEIRDKIAKIKEVTGNQELAFKEEDIEGDFDPAEHDRRMRALFDDGYYGHTDEEKPRFPDLDQELEIENWDKYEEENEEVNQNHNDVEPHCEDDDFIMDADYDPKRVRSDLLEEIQKTLGKKRRNRKRPSKLAQLLAKEKPTFTPAGAGNTYAQHMDEYYRLDCEDVVAGMPTRFKYREVEPNAYGLSVEEILLASDAELTAWVPLKRLVKLRPLAAERAAAAAYRQRATDYGLKRKLLPSLFRHLPEEPEIAVPVEGAKNKKKKTQEDISNNENEAKESIQPDRVEPVEGTDKKLKKKKKAKKSVNNDIETVGCIQLDSVEPVESAEKKRQKKKKEVESNENTTNDSIQLDVIVPVETAEKQNRKRKRENESVNYDNEPNGCVKSDVAVPAESIKKKRKKAKKKEIETSKNQNETAGFLQCVVPAEGTKKKRKKKKKEVATNNSIETNRFKQPGTVRSADGTKNKANKSATNSKNKKLKLKNKLRKKQGPDVSNENPLGKLSDERLKAYGLNPKKYRGFLKYKKF